MCRTRASRHASTSAFAAVHVTHLLAPNPKLTNKQRPLMHRIELKIQSLSSARARGARAPTNKSRPLMHRIQLKFRILSRRSTDSTHALINLITRPRPFLLHRIMLKSQILSSAGAQGATAPGRPTESTHRRINLMNERRPLMHQTMLK